MPKNLPMLRTSERASFKRCPQRWWWGWREGLRKAGEASQPLWFGTGIHLALAEWYIPGTKRGREPQETWAEYCEGHFESVRTSSVYQGDEEDRWMDALELGDAMLKYYREVYGLDSRWEVISPEQVFSALIAHPDFPRKAIIHFVGTFDGVFRDLETGKLKLLETKTAASISTKHLQLDDQAGGYIPLATHAMREAGELKPKERIHGIEYNFLAKKPPSDKLRDDAGRYRNLPLKAHFVQAFMDDDRAGRRFAKAEDQEAAEKAYSKMTVAALKEEAKDRGLTVMGEVSKIQPADTLLREFVSRTPTESKRQLERIGEEAMVMEEFRQERLPLFKNPTKDCSWDCDFFELCQLDEQGGDVEEFKKIAFYVQDPYMDHRAGAKNTKESVAAMRELLKGKG